MSSSTQEADPSSPIEFHSFDEASDVITSTMNDIPGYRVERVLGTVYGLTCNIPSPARTFSAIGKAFSGGEIKSFTRTIYQARNDAVERLRGECLSRGGNALIAMRFETSMLANYCVQVAAYGTACRVRKIEGSLVQDARPSGVEA